MPVMKRLLGKNCSTPADVLQLWRVASVPALRSKKWSTL